MTKQPRLKLPQYLDAVRKYVTYCVRCRTTENLEVAHYSGLYADRLGKGMGSKCHDYAVARLCRGCHVEMDTYASGNDEQRAMDFILAIEGTLHCLCWSIFEITPTADDLKQQTWITLFFRRMVTSRLLNETADETITMLAQQRDNIAERGK